MTKYLAEEWVIKGKLKNNEISKKKTTTIKKTSSLIMFHVEGLSIIQTQYPTFKSKGRNVCSFESLNDSI